MPTRPVTVSAKVIDTLKYAIPTRYSPSGENSIIIQFPEENDASYFHQGQTISITVNVPESAGEQLYRLLGEHQPYPYYPTGIEWSRLNTQHKEAYGRIAGAIMAGKES
jgi:hypothetical protein